MNHRRLRGVACAALFVAASCRITAPPDPNAGLGPRAAVYSPVISEQIGEIFVESDGLWAFLTPEEARAKTYVRGSVVAFGDLDERKRHLFTVVETASWGVRLQRLDADPVEGKTAGSLIPLSVLDRQTGARWGFCSGNGDIRNDECLQQADAGTRWWIYAVDPNNHVVSGDPREKSATLPVELHGQITVGTLGRDLISTKMPERWLAVPAIAPGARPTRPRIAVDPGCRDVGSPHRDALDAQWISAKVTPATNPLMVTSEAVRLGADAIVWCDGGNARVGIPTLYRPRMDVIGRGFAMPPMLGSRVVEIPAAGIGATDIVARLGAALSTGDYATADYLAERAAREFGAKRPLDRVLVDSMAAIAFGGRPEAAARLGGWATRLQWNPDNSAAWQIGMASIETTLGNRKSAIARTAGLTDVLDRMGDDGRRAWVAYFWAVQEIGARGAARDYLKPLEQHPGLALAARAEVALSSEQSLEGLQSEFDAAGSLDAWRALSAKLEPLGCESDRCAGDVYGRLWSSGNLDADDLSRVGRIELRPWFRLRPKAADALATLTDITAVFPLAEANATEELMAAATETAVGWARGACGVGAKADADRDAKLAKLAAIGEDAVLRTPEVGAMEATMAWLSTRGVKAACAETKVLADSANDLADETGVATVPTEFLALHIERANAEQILPVLETATSFAIDYERANRCAVWTVALAGAYADAADFEKALEWIRKATRCDVSQRNAVDLVNAYLNFQRTSTTSADFAVETRAELRGVAHLDVPKDVCVGALELDYAIIPALPEDVRSLATRLKIPTVKGGEDLSLVTATDRLGSAREHLKAASDQLDARVFKEAAQSLLHSRAAFETIGHEIGLARARWLERVLFADQAAAIVAGTADFAKVGFAPLRRKGTLAEQIEAGNTQAALARALLLDDVAAVESNLSKTTADRPVLCEASPRRVRGIAIDSVNGKLETLQKDDGPEIELVE